MLKSAIALSLILFTACSFIKHDNSLTGFWEGPHPENPDKKFYVQIDNSEDTVNAKGFWAENNFYQSKFEIESLIISQNRITFYVPDWNCTYSGVLANKNRIEGGFACPGEPFDSVRLVKNEWIKNYLIHAKPDCDQPNYQYSYSKPKDLEDGLIPSIPNSKNDSAFLLKLLPEIIRGDYGRINSFLILKNNQLIGEEYFYGYMQNELHQIESCTKSITSLLIGIALDKGFMDHVEQKIYEIFDEIPHLKNENYREITISHLLTMTSGFDVQEEKMSQTGNRFQFALNREIITRPGTQFQYDGGNTEILGEVLKRKTGINPDEFANIYLFEPLNILNYSWDGDDNNDFPLMSGSLSLQPGDMIKIGNMVLNDGKFNHQQIISKEWILESTSEKTKSHIPGDNYSYQWWNLNLESNGKNYPVIWANGWGSQFIFIIPNIDVVIVTTGHNYEYDSWAITDGIRKYLYLLDSNQKIKN